MGLWSRIKKALGIGSSEPEISSPPPQSATPQRTRPLRPTRGVDRDVSVSNPAWSSVQNYMNENLTDRGVEAFDDQQRHLAALFDVVADPHQDEILKRNAYEELEERLADFGFLFRGGLSNVSDFDWAEFKNNYPVI